MHDIPVETARSALTALPQATSHGHQPTPSDVYLPRSHLKALHPDNLLVTGMRGAGKTFWWSALQDSDVRGLVGQLAERSTLSERTEIRTGFGVTQDPEKYPSKDILRSLMRAGIEPRDIWRAVQAWQVAPSSHPLRLQPTWQHRTRYVIDNPELIERLFAERDREFDRNGVYFLVLFDALDRCADDWREMYRVIRGLLQTAIELRSYRRLRVKVFLRSDQFNESEIGDFPDASKALSSSVSLNWPRHELYGLLWHYLANGDHGAELRRFFGNGWDPTDAGHRGLYSVPRMLIVNDEHQRERFHALSGPWMGRGPRRGFPYTWIPSHLADTEGKVSPRSFLAALRTAADDTQDRHPQHEFALHFESIKRGVQEASQIRVRELQEDYPWVHRVLSPLAGVVVPCRFSEIAGRWRTGAVLDGLADEAQQGDVKLPPRHMARGADGVREDLESLGVFLRMRDERVNIPDVFRVGYRLGRRGGVRPIR